MNPKDKIKGSFPQVLTTEDEKYYLDMFLKGNDEEKKYAKDELVTRNLRLVAHIAKKYHFHEPEDLISIGTIGLIKAVNTFNPERAVKLATYASRCIENEILMHMRQMKKKSREMFMTDTIGVDSDGHHITIEDRLRIEEYAIDDTILLNADMRHMYDKMRNVLTTKEKYILTLRYGLGTGISATQREVSDLMNISRSYVSRLEKRALLKMRDAIDS